MVKQCHSSHVSSWKFETLDAKQHYRIHKLHTEHETSGLNGGSWREDTCLGGGGRVYGVSHSPM